ncbi:MAG: hypothetical protein N2652_05615 [Kiritimatiellae bacterium]|nr:hypothetical protein [Kiritimatiellia bacterium]
MNATNVDIGGWLRTTWELYKKHFGLLVAIHLILAVLGGLTLGILWGPLWLGASMIVLALVDGKTPPPVGDVFNGFSKFLPSFLLVLTVGLSSVLVSLLLQLTCILAPLAPLAVLGIVTATMFAVFLIGERNLDFWPAVQRSFELVKPVFWPLLAWILLLSAVSGVGAILCGVGVVLTMPLQTCGLAVAYRRVVGGPPASEPTVAPPPPAPAAG